MGGCSSRGSLKAPAEAAVQLWNEAGNQVGKKSQAIAQLKSLARRASPVQAAELFTILGVVDTLVDAAENEPATQLEALQSLNLLAAKGGNYVRMFKRVDVIQALLKAAANDASTAIQSEAFQGLQLYIVVQKDKMTVLESHPEVLDVSLKVARNGGTTTMKQLGLSTICVLGCSQTARRMVEYPMLVDTLFELGRDKNKQIQQSVLNCIWNITDHPTVADLLVEKHNLLALLNDHRHETDKVPSIYLNLTIPPKTREFIANDAQVLDTLQRFAKSTDNRAQVISKMALVVLKPFDATYLRLDKITLVTIMKILVAAVARAPYLDVIWPLVQPLLVLRYLTTLPENRAILAIELAVLPLAIEIGLKDDVADPVLCTECALSCMLQYVSDARIAAAIKKVPDFLAVTKKVVDQKQSDPAWATPVGLAQNIVTRLSAGTGGAMLISSNANGRTMIVYTDDQSLNNNGIPLAQVATGPQPAVLASPTGHSATAIPKTADDLRAWGVSRDVSPDVIDAMVKEGYLGEELLRDLQRQPITDLKTLLALDQAAKASKLHKELGLLFGVSA